MWFPSLFRGKSHQDLRQVGGDTKDGQDNRGDNDGNHVNQGFFGRCYSSVGTMIRKPFVSLWNLASTQATETDYDVEFEKQIGKAKLQLMRNCDFSIKDPFVAIVFWSKEDIQSERGQCKPVFRRKMDRPESGRLGNKEMFKKLRRNEIFVNDDEGSYVRRVLHIPVDLGNIYESVEAALIKTELETMVAIVIGEKDSLNKYADDIYSEVLNFCLNGKCKYKRTIIFDVRNQEAFLNVDRKMRSTDDYEEDIAVQSKDVGVEDLEVEVEEEDDNGTLHISCSAQVGHVTRTVENFNYDDLKLSKDITLKWKYFCDKERALSYLKRCLKEKTSHVAVSIEKNNTIAVNYTDTFPSKKQMKKWRTEVHSTVHDIFMNKIKLFKMQTNRPVRETIDELKEHDLIKQLKPCIWFDPKTSSVTICGLFKESEKKECIEELKRIDESAKSKKQNVLFSIESPVEKFQILSKSGILADVKDKHSNIGYSYNYSKKRIDFTGPKNTDTKIQKQIKSAIDVIPRVQLNLKSKQRLLLCKSQTQEYVIQRLHKEGLNSSLEVSALDQSKSVKVYAFCENKDMTSGTIDIVRNSIKILQYSIHEYEEIFSSRQWPDLKDELEMQYDGRISIEKDRNLHQIIITCTDDLEEVVKRCLSEIKETKVTKTLKLVNDRFHFIRQCCHKSLTISTRLLGIKVSLREQLDMKSDCSQSFEFEGTEQAVDKLIYAIENDFLSDVITREITVSNENMVGFLSRNDDSIFNDLSKQSECYIRTQKIDMEDHSTHMWSASSGRVVCVCKGKAPDAEVVVRMKDIPKGKGTIKQDVRTGKHEELLIPFVKGHIDMDLYQQHLDEFFKHLEGRRCETIAFPVTKSHFGNTPPQEVMSPLVQKINSFFTLHHEVSISKIYFQDAWEDFRINLISEILDQHFDRFSHNDDSIIRESLPALPDDQYRSSDIKRKICITGKAENVKAIMIDQHLNDLMFHQRTISRSSSLDSLESYKSLPAKFTGDVKRSRSPDGSVKSDWRRPQRHRHEHRTQTWDPLSYFSEADEVFEQPKQNAELTNAQQTTPGKKVRKSQNDTMVVGNIEIYREYYDSVGQIQISDTNVQLTTGTGFVVQGGYFMSAYHIFKEIIDYCHRLGHEQQDKEWKTRVRVVFGQYHHDPNKNKITTHHLQRTPVYFDQVIDFVIFKLDTNTHSPVPRPVILCEHEFETQPRTKNKITFLGYPEGKPLTLDPDCPIIDPHGKDIGEARIHVYHKLKEDPKCYDGLQDDRYLVLHSQAREGSSGASGFFIDSHHRAVVCCMFQEIYPEFAFRNDKSVSLESKYMFERALKMSTVYKELYHFTSLREQIFSDEYKMDCSTETRRCDMGRTDVNMVEW